MLSLLICYLILEIQYNSLNLPTKITFNSNAGFTNNYVYRADGIKVRVSKHNLSEVMTTDYIGNRVYENELLKRRLIDGGYIEDGQYYYYLTDHLGSTRVVSTASGEVVQTNHYYPYGLTFAEGVDTSNQPYLFNGKEFDRDRSLNLYDYGARFMDSQFGRFTTIDPLSEIDPAVSPYAYCRNNPIRFIDPDGRMVDDYTAMLDGTISIEQTNDSFDKFFVEKKSGEIKEVATLEKHTTAEGVTLVKFPEQGAGFTRYGEADTGGDRFVQPTVAAALFGAINATTEYDNTIITQLGDMSAENGGKPGTAHAGGAMSHVNGRNVDVRYIRSDRSLTPVTVFDTTFDTNANQNLVNNFRNFGFKNILSYPNNTISMSNHHHHLHLQGFNPRIK